MHCNFYQPFLNHVITTFKTNLQPTVIQRYGRTVVYRYTMVTQPLKNQSTTPFQPLVNHYTTSECNQSTTSFQPLVNHHWQNRKGRMILQPILDSSVKLADPLFLAPSNTWSLSEIGNHRNGIKQSLVYQWNLLIPDMPSMEWLYM